MVNLLGRYVGNFSSVCRRRAGSSTPVGILRFRRGGPPAGVCSSDARSRARLDASSPALTGRDGETFVFASLAARACE